MNCYIEPINPSKCEPEIIVNTCVEPDTYIIKGQNRNNIKHPISNNNNIDNDITKNIHKFNSLFDEILKTNSNNIKNQLYTTGIQLLTDQNYTSNQKEDILNKLIFVFPDEYILYYYMGCITKEYSIHKSLVWYKICFEKNPNYIENILDLLKILFDNGYYNYIKEFDEVNDRFLQNIQDSRIKILLASYYSKIKKQEQSIPIFLELIKSNNMNDDLLSICYTNLGLIYNELSNNKYAIDYLHKAIECISKTNEGVYNHSNGKQIFDNLLLLYDYEYVDNNKMYETYLYYNTLVYESKTFDFLHRPKNNKIKIGYVSGDFTTHVITSFILPILSNHDTNLFEVYCFSNYHTIEKCYFEQCSNKNVYFHYINELNTQSASSYIYNLNIDILIDLNGHTQFNRLDVFALNPAPIQITYLGYPNTTGLKSMHYRITDSIADNPNSLQKYSEKLLYLPKCFLLYKSITQLKPIQPSQVVANNIILGAFNKEAKNSESTLCVWKQIMHVCPNTKILIKKSSTQKSEDRIAFYLKKLDISRERLILIEFLEIESDYINLFSKIDIHLDTFPYSGTTTTCNALYNSIPVITKYHPNYHSHNVSSSLLVNSGLLELIAYSNDEYVSKTVNLINNPTQITHYKNTIHSQFMECMNPTDFMKTYEKMLVELI
jgi:protein O-GlcNAc transferase